MLIYLLVQTLGSISEAALAWWLLSDYGWRVLLAASATPLGTFLFDFPVPITIMLNPYHVPWSALLLLLFPLLPESPRYLIAKGQRDAAEKVCVRPEIGPSRTRDESDSVLIASQYIMKRANYSVPLY